MNGIITNEMLQRKFDCTAQELEALRNTLGGNFRARRFKKVKHRGRLGHRWTERVQLSDWDPWRHNIVVNTGLASLPNVHLDAATQITSWYLALAADASPVTPLATHTYASPGYTEADGADLDELTRQIWTPGNTSGTTTASIDNTASPATFTGDQAFTAQGCGLVGGGTDPDTLADTAGGGTLFSSGLFASSHAMDLDVQLEVDYTFTFQDDGA